MYIVLHLFTCNGIVLSYLYHWCCSPSYQWCHSFLTVSDGILWWDVSCSFFAFLRLKVRPPKPLQGVWSLARPYGSYIFPSSTKMLFHMFFRQRICISFGHREITRIGGRWKEVKIIHILFSMRAVAICCLFQSQVMCTTEMLDFVG